VGVGYDAEVADALLPQASKWQEWATSAKKFSSTITAALAPILYAAGVAAVIYALVKGRDQLSVINIIQLTGIAVELSIRSLSALAATRLGTWLQETFLNNRGISKTLGEWFTETGIAVVDESSTLVKLMGSSSAKFLVNRLGPVLSLVAVGVSIEALVAAVRNGTRTDVIYASLNLALSVINVTVVFIGLAATAAEAGSALALAGSLCGPIGLALAVIGIIVGIVSLFVHDQPAVANPPADFVSGPVKDSGFYK